ncbi:MAG: NADH-quinone oxidoreductase subunit A [candidate division Zixibacteria bacterium]
MFATFFPILVLFLIASVIVLVMMFLPEFLAKKTENRRKVTPYECGIVPDTDARERFPVKFYMIALLFIVFDLEMVFLYPWAIVLKKLKMFAFYEMLVFIGVLLLGYLYIVKKGALKWD